MMVRKILIVFFLSIFIVFCDVHAQYVHAGHVLPKTCFRVNAPAGLKLPDSLRSKLKPEMRKNLTLILACFCDSVGKIIELRPSELIMNKPGATILGFYAYEIIHAGKGHYKNIDLRDDIAMEYSTWAINQLKKSATVYMPINNRCLEKPTNYNRLIFDVRLE